MRYCSSRSSSGSINSSSNSSSNCSGSSSGSGSSRSDSSISWSRSSDGGSIYTVVLMVVVDILDNRYSINVSQYSDICLCGWREIQRVLK